ncbi:Zinc-regulated transporter 2 [Smittium culicis]|uniref:Zinc-regulated transporter 2 n=1 Tax=Smittium culicis TaxID=133412 RepID=A0A1R1X2N9_9FUNG|nr:Zinc-regulated transporter 2 [Smittium culicis]
MVHIFQTSIDRLTDKCILHQLGGFKKLAEIIFLFSIFFMHILEHIIERKANELSQDSSSTPDNILSEANIAVKEDSVKKYSVAKSSPEIGHALVPQDLPPSSGCGKKIDFDFKRNFSNYVLEFSVASHSVIVGFTLGLTPKKETSTLTIALSFHQFFEGISMGDRLVEMYKPSASNILMFIGSTIYMLSTPFGQLIGILSHNSFAPKSAGSLISLGVLEAICSGILLYTTVFNLILVEFKSNNFKEYSKTKKILCFCSMYLGTALMSVVGHWG